jgi:DNA-binding MarR family transcriptional regulator
MEIQESTTKDWNFLSNHAHVLIHLNRFPDSLVKEISIEIGITQRSTQLILADLQEGGYVVIEKIGRRNHYRVNPKGKFRHRAEKNKSVGSLLEIFS